MKWCRKEFGLEEIGKIAASISQAEQFQNPSKQTVQYTCKLSHSHTR